MYLIAAFSYSISIFIDVFSYHLKVYISDNKNLRYIFSLINIFQFSARAFMLIYMPIMAYFTETIKDKHLVWNATLLSHFFVVLIISPLLYRDFSVNLCLKIIRMLNRIFGKHKNLNFTNTLKNEMLIKENKTNKIYFVFLTYSSGFIFSFSMTFLYYLTFYFPTKALTLSSYSQVINMIGMLILVLLIDPKIMSSIDSGGGEEEIRLLTKSRILAHLSLIILLFAIK